MILSSIIASLPPTIKSFMDSWSMFDIKDQTLNRFIEKFKRAKILANDEEQQSAFLALRGHCSGSNNSEECS